MTAGDSQGEARRPNGARLLSRRDRRMEGIHRLSVGCVGHLIERVALPAEQKYFARDIVAAWMENYGVRLLEGEWEGEIMNFYADVIQKDARFRSVESVRDLDLLEPVTRVAVLAIIADAEAMGITLCVTETYRSVERQEHLFATHATQLRDVGVHHYGLAADFCKIVEGKASWEGDWKFLRDLAVKHGLVSGLDWGHPERPHTFCDSDHVQRIAVADQGKLFAGAWYPGEDYVTA